jgi:hypothetical protein
MEAMYGNSPFAPREVAGSHPGAKLALANKFFAEGS